MKAICHAAFLLVLPAIIFAGEVKHGDTREEVRAALGTPRGQSQLGARELLYFDRGEVELRAGVVTRVALRTERDQAALDARRAASAELVRLRQESLHLEGTALKARLLDDASFQATPLSYQVAYWENFSRRYSTVSCLEELSIARVRLNEQVGATQQVEQAQRNPEIEAQAKAAVRADRDRTFYPIIQPVGYSRDYYASERRQRRLDREYYERVCDSSNERPDGVNWNSASHRDQEYRHIRPTTPAPAARDPFNWNQSSSHSAEAFSGKNWLVWPSPPQPSRTGSF